MLVRVPAVARDLRVLQLRPFGEIVLALPLDGEPRPFTGTAIDEPGAAANARTLANSLRRITLDDNAERPEPAVPSASRTALAFCLTNRFRGGDTVAERGRRARVRLQPVPHLSHRPGRRTQQANPRPPAPEPVGGTLHVAAMNTLNYFLTLDQPNTTPPNPLDNMCGALQTLECRGADSDQPAGVLAPADQAAGGAVRTRRRRDRAQRAREHARCRPGRRHRGRPQRISRRRHLCRRSTRA